MSIGVTGVYVFLFLALYFEVFLFISFFEKRPTKKTNRRPSHYPTVSIIVPCWNEEKTIGGTLDSLLALTYPTAKLSVLVVDDGSTDNTARIARAYAEKHPQISFYSKENGGKYTALNFGIAHTTSELVGCLDADSFVAPDALLEVAKTFEDKKDLMAITPAMKVHQPRSLLELMQAAEYTFGIFYKKMFDNLSAISVLPGPFSLYRREVFERIGLFRHAHNTEDMEIAFRMHANGLQIGNAHTAYVYTKVPNTPWALIKQRTRWSQGFLQNSRDYAYMYFNRKYGNFGLLILPVGLLAFIGGMYMAMYMAYQLVHVVVSRGLDLLATGIPLLQLPESFSFSISSLPSLNSEWLYFNIDTTMFIVAAVMSLTLAAILLGSRLAEIRLPIKSFFSFFILFGLIAPIWLVRAAFGAALARQSTWR